MQSIVLDLDLLTSTDIKEHGVIERWQYIEKNREKELKNGPSSVRNL
jgi:hypothetical protein